MGTLDTERERERRQMYLLLLLLVSPAFGRPSSDQLDVGEDISNQLAIFTNFNNETGKLFVNSSVIKNVVKMLLEAENHIREMYVEQKKIETEHILFEDNFFEEFNEAKSHLRQTGQGLRKLAHRTVADVRDLKTLLGAFDESNDNDPFFLKIFINRMEDLMIETLEALKEAREKYNSAVENFDNLNSNITVQNLQLKKLGMEACSTENRCLGLAEDINEEIRTVICAIEMHLEKSCRPELGNLKAISDKMLESGNNFEKTIKVGIALLNKEIELILIWNKSAKTVSKNIDEYPVEFLREFKSLRTVFINGFDDLKNAADKFLAQPKDIL